MKEKNFVDISVEATVEATFTKIKAALQRSAEGVLDAADLIVQFSKHKDYPMLTKELVKNKLMAKSTISQYSTIGKCAVLRSVINKLPQSFNSLYHLAKLEREQSGFIQNLISNGKLSPSTTLEYLRGYGTSTKSKWSNIVVEVDSKTDADMREQLRKMFIELAKQIGVDVKVPSPKKPVNKGGKK